MLGDGLKQYHGFALTYLVKGGRKVEISLKYETRRAKKFPNLKDMIQVEVEADVISEQ